MWRRSAFQALAILLPLVGLAPAHGEPPGGAPAARLELMKEAVKVYEFTRDDRRSAAFKLQDAPAFRLGKQGEGDLAEGAIFLWNDEAGRPEAAAQVFLIRYVGDPEDHWIHEFTSLSARPFAVTSGGSSVWAPRVPGLTFAALPGAPKPAASPVARLRQMRALAGEFRAEDDFGDRGWIFLRMLATPIARYGKSGGTPEDGALFAFVRGTDPEVFLFVEARRGTEGLEWQFAVAPMSCFALKAERKGQLVWSLPRRATEDPSKPFFDLSIRSSGRPEEAAKP